MKTKNPVLAVILLSVTFCLSGCYTIKTYSGPRLPSNQIAIIKSQTSMRQDQIVITEVDGKPAKDMWGYPGMGGTKIELFPGTHTIKGFYVKYEDGPYARTATYYEPVTITLSVRAGEVYRVDHTEIKEERTGTVVGRFK